MRSHRQKGFILFMVIIFLAILGLFMAVLTSHLKNLGSEITVERLKVYNANIMSSALAWANQNKNLLVEKTTGQTIDLDVSELGINGGKATITVVAIDEEKIKINMTAQCARARLKLKKTKTATIKTPIINLSNP